MTEHSFNLDRLSRVKDGTGHSLFGASGSPMYLACAGSLIPNILAPDDAGFDAAWGTTAHAVTEQWLNTGIRPVELLGQKRFVGNDIDTGHLITIDEEMLYNAGLCVDRCEWEPGEQLIEYHTDFSHLTPIPNQGGTLDFAALRPGRATVVDHKFGASPENRVDAEDNTQLMLYTIGLWRDPKFAHYDFKEFIIRINQPRLNHFDEWCTTTKRLAEFEDYCRERMALAWQPDAPRTPGAKQCRFCKVKASCAANAKLQEDLVTAVFADTTQTAEQMQSFVRKLDDDFGYHLKFASVHELTTAQLARLRPFRHMAEAWWSALDEVLTQRAIDGENVEGFKLVEGRTHRKFRSEADARARLIDLGLSRSQIYSESMCSPNQAEELLRKKGLKGAELQTALKGLVFKPPGKKTLVPVSDPRTEAQDVMEAVFGPTTINRETAIQSTEDL